MSRKESNVSAAGRHVPCDHASEPILCTGRVIANEFLCDEHLEMTLRLDANAKPHVAGALPGQFLHVKPTADNTGGGPECTTPLLRRAFSISSLRESGDGLDVGLIYRVVGQATSWLGGLIPGDVVSVIGPLGQPFPVPDFDVALLVGGGVGLPPLIWLAEHLRSLNRECVVFYGAQKRSLLAMPLADTTVYPTDGAAAMLSGPDRFSQSGAALVLSTDDGGLGFQGFAPQALEAYLDRESVVSARARIYTCGPEVMMRSVANICRDRDIEGFFCMERAMACGTGTCQSCVVEIADTQAVDGWRYSLCCTEGPVYSSNRLLWSVPA